MQRIKKKSGEIKVSLNVSVLEVTHDMLANTARIKEISIGQLLDEMVAEMKDDD